MTDPLVIAVTGCVGCPLLRQGADESDSPEFCDEGGGPLADFCSVTHQRIDGGAATDVRPAWCPLDVRPVLVRIAAPRPDVDDSAAGVRFSLLELE
jgi:hypothetical protein